MAVGKAAIDRVVRSRAEQIRSQASSWTLRSVRRLLEEDLGLKAGQLDNEKLYIKELVDKVLQGEYPEHPVEDKGEADGLDDNSHKIHHKKMSYIDKHKCQVESEEEGEPVKPKRRRQKEEEDSDVEGSEEEGRKKKKRREHQNKAKSTTKSHDVTSQVRKPPTKVATHCARVEHTKRVCQAAGIKIPPHVYKKANQAPAEKREEALVKELEALLEKEALCSTSSEKDIKAVKKSLDKQRELEGIDMSNILDEPRGRRRSAATPAFMRAPPARERDAEADSGSGSEGEEDGEDDDEDDEDEDHELQDTESEEEAD
eukprot:jgi/Mesen1/5107/ME000254S04130